MTFKKRRETLAYTTWYDLTKAIAEATREIRVIELREGYRYDPHSERICDQNYNVLKDCFHHKRPDVAAVRLEKQDGRRIWARKDILLAIAQRGWPKSECWVCGVKIPYLWDSTVDRWLPDYRTEGEHALSRRDSAFLCYEALVEEKPPNEGRSRRASFCPAILEALSADPDLPAHLDFVKDNANH